MTGPDGDESLASALAGHLEDTFDQIERRHGTIDPRPAWRLDRPEFGAGKAVPSFLYPTTPGATCYEVHRLPSCAGAPVVAYLSKIPKGVPATGRGPAHWLVHDATREHVVVSSAGSSGHPCTSRDAALWLLAQRCVEVEATRALILGDT